MHVCFCVCVCVPVCVCVCVFVCVCVLLQAGWVNRAVRKRMCESQGEGRNGRGIETERREE